MPTVDDALDLTSPDAADRMPGWRPVLAGITKLHGSREAIRLVWNQSTGLEAEGSHEFTVAVAVVRLILSGMCDRCGASGEAIRLRGGGRAVRCAEHAGDAVSFEGPWDALDQTVWAPTRRELMPVVAMSRADRGVTAVWLLEEAPRLAAEAQGRALVAAHRDGDDTAIMAALEIPAHDPDRARAIVEASPLLAALREDDSDAETGR